MMVFGAIYLAVGVLLWRGSGKVALIAGLVLPAVGGTLGVLNSDPGSVSAIGLSMLAVDIVVPLICLWLLVKQR